MSSFSPQRERAPRLFMIEDWIDFISADQEQLESHLEANEEERSSCPISFNLQKLSSVAALCLDFLAAFLSSSNPLLGHTQALSYSFRSQKRLKY